jgi:hypothetical protein
LAVLGTVCAGVTGYMFYRGSAFAIVGLITTLGILLTFALLLRQYLKEAPQRTPKE